MTSSQSGKKGLVVWAIIIASAIAMGQILVHLFDAAGNHDDVAIRKNLILLAVVFFLFILSLLLIKRYAKKEPDVQDK